jgi:hypothetical protein
MFGGVLKLLQDFIAPIFLFLQVDYELTMKKAGDILSSGEIVMEATINKKIAGKETRNFHSGIKIFQDGVFEIEVKFKEAKIKITCQNELE